MGAKREANERGQLTTISNRMAAYLILHNSPFGMELVAGILLGSGQFTLGIFLLALAVVAKASADVLYFSVMRRDVVRPEMGK